MAQANNVNIATNFTGRVQEPSVGKKYILSNKLRTEKIAHPTRAKPNETSTGSKAIKSGAPANDALTRLYNCLTVRVRYLINKIKYFEINKDIYAVTIDPKNSLIKVGGKECVIKFI